MSNIAGLLSNLMSLPQPDTSARGPSGQPNGAAPGKGGANGFDAILSKLGQNGGSANAKAFAQLSGNPSGTAKPGAAAGEDTNTIIENAIASTDAQTADAAAARTAASKLMSNAAATAASVNAKTAAANAASTRTGKASADAQEAGPGNGAPAAKTALSGRVPLPGAQGQLTGSAAAQATGAKTAAATTAQLSASLAAAASDASPSADTVEGGEPQAAKSQTEDAPSAVANNAVNNIAANAAAVVADIVAGGQPVATPSGADKAHAGGKPGRSTNADGTSRTSSKQSSSTAKTDTPAANATLDPSLQSVVLASAGINMNAGTPAQPSLPVQSEAGSGSSDPNLKAIMTASAIAEANSNAKMGTGAEQVDDPDAPTILRVLSTETHFAPAEQLSPVQQIADTVIGALPNPSHLAGTFAAETDAGDAGPSGVSSAASAGSTPNSTSSAIVGPVKILNLQLEPPNLGTVTINLSLSDGGLNVQLAASQVSTMSLIDKDKDTLSNQLRESGYSIAGVGVTMSIDGSNVPNQGSATQDQFGQSAAQGGQTMSNGGSSNGNGSSQGGGNGSAYQPQTASDFSSASPTRSPAAGDLYI